MPSRRYPTTGDPRLKTPSYLKILAYWKRIKPEMCEATRCLHPGQPITYTTTRTPTSLDVGHHIPRDQDTRPTWTIADTRPEHQHCNRADGLALAKSKARRSKRGTTQPQSTPAIERSITSTNW